MAGGQLADNPARLAALDDTGGSAGEACRRSCSTRVVGPGRADQEVVSLAREYTARQRSEAMRSTVE